VSWSRPCRSMCERLETACFKSAVAILAGQEQAACALTACAVSLDWPSRLVPSSRS
jgi:hypothetical protein